MTPVDSIASNPFAVLTFIAAPALLTNASSVLAMSTINRMLRTRDRMQELFTDSETKTYSDTEAAALVHHVDRVERQAVLLLDALRAIYTALGAFAGATLVTLLGAGLAPSQGPVVFRVLAGVGLALGAVGVSGLILASARLLGATQLSLAGIREQSAMIRARHAAIRVGAAPPPEH